METNSKKEKLVKYFIDDKVVVTGFENFDEAGLYASDKNGTFVQIAFKGGNDNPDFSDEAGLVANRSVYFADQGPEYQFIFSDNPKFKDFAGELLQASDDFKDESKMGEYVDGVEALKEDPVIILRNGNFDGVTSREASRYRGGIAVYELGVRKDLDEDEKAELARLKE